MKSFAVCLISLLASVSAASAYEPTVLGQVRLADGSAVAGAQVMLFDVSDLRRGALGQATTDADGQFVLPLVGFDKLSPQLGGRGLPTRFALGQNYPNPFNPSTVIPYQLLTAAHVRLEVFNVLGQRVATLVDGEQVAGAYTAVWTATDEAGQAVSAGVYIYRLVAGDATATGRMVLVDGQAGAVPLSPQSALTSARAELVEALPEAGGSAYGLVVSGIGLVPYMDADFRVGSRPVVIEVEAQGRAKVVQDERGILGDVDNNGQVNLLDALLVAMYLANPASVLPDGSDIALGDVNGDGVLNLTDAWLIGTYAYNPSAAGLPGGIGEPATGGGLVGGFDAPTRLTDHESADYQPSWSPDGTQLVFQSTRDGETDIYVMGADGSNPTRLTEEGYNGSPSWSPDGTKIAFSSSNDDGIAIFVMGSDGSAPTRLTYRGNNGSPSWSPDGARIAFAATPTPSANLEIFVMGSDGSNLTRLTEEGWNDSPVWSPDGSKIAFVSNRGTGEVDTFDVYAMGSDGSSPTRLTDTGDNRSPSWSPDGARIAFQSTRDGETDIYVMGSDGSDGTRLTDTGDNRSPSWSPDGTRIAFLSTRDGNWDIYVAMLDAMVSTPGVVVDIPIGGDGAVGEERAFPLPGGAEMEFVWIEPGVFWMGSPDSEEGRYSNEGPVHEVEISRGFWLGKYEVTQGQWEAVMRSNPASHKGVNHPVHNVSFYDVQEFIIKLNEAAGSDVYRLPSEAEWEYACRAGTSTRWSFGDDEIQLGQHAWYMNNSPNRPSEVGKKLPNPWGLYDMHGNVYEWVQDGWDASYYANSPRVDPPGGSGSNHVARGGNFAVAAQHLRSAFRGQFGPSSRGPWLGFRLLRIR